MPIFAHNIVWSNYCGTPQLEFFNNIRPAPQPIAIEWISSQTCTRVVVEIFDDHGVSFVSVTQPFNTTSSMGRLMLNVLLSFAQFEREVIGELYRTKRPSFLAIWKRR